MVRLSVIFISMFSLCFSLCAEQAGILVTDDGHRRAAVFDNAGKLIWEHAFHKPYDVHMLADNTLLVGTGKGVQHLTIAGEILLDYKAKGEIFSVIPLPNGNFLAGNTTQSTLIELTPKGKVVKTIQCTGSKGHGSMRIVRLTPEGTYLVGHLMQNVAREYDKAGKIVAEFKALGPVYEARRLKDGTTAVAWNQGVVIYDKSGTLIREIKAKQLKKMGIKWLNTISERENGNLLLGNWLGHGHHRQGVPFFEVDKDNNVVWKFTDNNQVLQATNVVPLSQKQLDLFIISGSTDDATVKFDFEDGKLGDWKMVEGRFPRLITDRSVQFHSKNRMAKSGVYFLSTLDDKDGRSSDKATGVIQSPLVKLEQPKISFLVCGGVHKNQTYIAICNEGGKELKKFSGKNDQILRKVTLQLPKMVGKKIFIRVVDRHNGDWGHIIVDDVRMYGTVDKEGSIARFEAEKKRKIQLTLTKEINLPALKAAINDLTETYPKQYKGWKEKLAVFEDKCKSLEKTLAKEPDFVNKLKQFKRDALVANPAVSANPILYTTRRQYRGDHHNTATLFQTNEINTGKYDPIGELKTIDLKTGKVTTILNHSKTSLVRDPDVSWDGKMIIFSMRKEQKDDYHIYEINADGTGLKQLTRAKQVSDIDPVYLPDNAIVFSSTREPKYCMCNRHIMANMYRMEADGANIHQIGRSTLFEGHTSVMPDGRLLYDRWEYVDRNFGDAQGLWVVNPDGTKHAIFYGNNTNSPGGVIDGRIIPGTNLCLCIFGSCHDRPWGTLAIIDRGKGVDGRPPVVRTWPEHAINQVGKGNWDAFIRFKPKYEDPYPLNDKYFLVSRSTGRGEEMGIALVDVYGNEIMLHAEVPGCYDPMPLVARKRPPVLPMARDFSNKPGTFYVQDCYIGTNMKGIKRGDVKYLRVVESPEKRTWTNQMWGGQGTIAPGINWHDFSNKKVMGVVPVEEDGSAFFECPADTFVFFQLLDKNGKMLQTMRTGTIIQTGETQGCIGCHDDRAKPPVVSGKQMALQRAPSKLNGWYGPVRFYNYQKEMQPVWDKHCISCHDYGKKAEKHVNLSGDKTLFFNTSYTELWKRKLITCVGGGPAEILEPRTWGSFPSKLTKALEKGHHDVKLSKEEWDRIYTWVDLNGPYYPDYDSAYPLNLAGRSPLDHKQLKRLGELTGLNFFGMASHHGNKGAMMSFERPELSPCLKKLKKGSAEYKEALSIIQAGQENLKKKPRIEMENFIAAPYALERQEFYRQRKEHEKKVRKAIRDGEKIYDN